ncbi:hypothetical protein PF005_g554 [Phytophthora fragariae]|uniref:Peptidase A2 domain-containing protein n=1 Tax=Phytophthora fragariae TaxID=53985 RepID=A0A6A3MN72_9STRA|nr:hypothetical protein PF003_g19187 [Phytophthora fragariae]KAE9030998.1 hypothetical protein PF011_g340 [Phytophthora fragariae]KAE9140447.1 hypothetical protein PF007_g640 [Phytophthora fragariae]KAE9153213.1 hypothetical protein PF006_g2647 [Phytophthora fragariae]KAE9237664.1 hypothetical protein PF005_g554 [Phytophthora fragariae]
MLSTSATTVVSCSAACAIFTLASVNGDSAVSAFFDSGASFNAIDPPCRRAARIEHANPIQLTIGTNRSVLGQRRFMIINIKLDGFPVYSTDAFDLELPENKNVLLGHP